MPNIQFKMKTGTINALAAKKEDGITPSVGLVPGSIYYAIDTTNHIGKIVYDAPNGNNVDRIVMSTRAEVTDKVITKEDNTHQLFFSGFQSSGSAVDGLNAEDLIENDINLNFKRSRNFYNTETSLIGGNLYINDGLEVGFDSYNNHGNSEVKGSFLTVSSGEVNIGSDLLIGNLTNRKVTINGPLTATNSVEFTGNTASTSVGTGTLLVTGGVGIKGQLTANVVQADTQIVINSDNTDSLFGDYNFYVNGTSRLEELVTVNNDIQFLNSGTETRQIRMNVNSTDFGRFATGVTAGNGWSELATSGTGNEPIYIRQYSGVYATLVNSLTLLNADGDSIFPGNILPETNSIKNIGSSANKWNNVYAINFIGHLEGNADKATAANITSTLNGVAFYTNTAGTFGNIPSRAGALYSTGNNTAPTFGTLPVAQGGTGAKSFSPNSVIVSGTTQTGALTTRAITNNTAITAISEGNTNIITQNTLYNALALINNDYQKRSTSIYAPITGGTAGQVLVAKNATSAPEWKTIENVSPPPITIKATIPAHDDTSITSGTTTSGELSYNWKLQWSGVDLTLTCSAITNDSVIVWTIDPDDIGKIKKLQRCNFAHMSSSTGISVIRATRTNSYINEPIKVIISIIS